MNELEEEALRKAKAALVLADMQGRLDEIKELAQRDVRAEAVTHFTALGYDIDLAEVIADGLEDAFKWLADAIEQHEED